MPAERTDVSGHRDERNRSHSPVFRVIESEPTSVNATQDSEIIDDHNLSVPVDTRRLGLHAQVQSTSVVTPVSGPTISNNNSNSNTHSGTGDIINNNGNVNVQSSPGALVNSSVNVIVPHNSTVSYDKYKKKLLKTIRTSIGDRFVSDALHDTQPKHAGCMSQTRESVFAKIMIWILQDPTRIFWLDGMAGTGKTSVAVTLCRNLHQNPDVVLGGSFFCSRLAYSTSRTDVRLIVPTLAEYLASISVVFAAALANELALDSRAAQRTVSDQVNVLLARPLAKVTFIRPVVFVIDALDECSDEHGYAELLTAIADLVLDSKVKFFITSRPEMDIRGTLVSSPDHSTILQLHTIREEEVSADICRFITGTLPARGTGAIWYTDSDVAALVSLSNGLFIFASTVLKYIQARGDDTGRRKRLDKVLYTATGGSEATVPLDRIYEMIILEATRSGSPDAEELQQTQRVLSCILCARTSLSVQAIADLLEAQVDDVRGSLERLHSVIFMPPDDVDSGVRALHASFGDYIVSQRAAEHIRLSAPLGHKTLADACLQLMNKHLHFNISQSHDSYKANPETRLEKFSLSLEYSCLHWIYHVDGAPDAKTLEEDLQKLFLPLLLFWLEVMSVLRKVRRAAAMLHFAAVRVRMVDLAHFFRDANAFVASSCEVIEWSAPHIYISALPFAGKDSLVYQRFSPRCRGLISVESSGLDQHGGRLRATLTGHDSAVNSVAYCPNSRLICSGSEDGTVRVWDTRTNEETMPPLRCCDGAVYSVAFSPDGRSVAAATNGRAVHLWRLISGPIGRQRLTGRAGRVWCVKFSPDGTLLASGSGKTVSLWKAKDGSKVTALRGHTSRVTDVAFSPNGTTLASSSADRTIRVWHLATRDLMIEPLRGGEGEALCISFSPDGTVLASGYSHSNIRLWDPKSGVLLSTLRGHSDIIRSVQFSPDGQSLVSASNDRSIRFWSILQGESEAQTIIYTGHTDSACCTTFSPDGLFVASASADSTIRIWDAHSRQRRINALPVHEDCIRSVAVSPDGTFIVSGSDDLTVRVWDSQTGAARLDPLSGHSAIVTSVAISSDGLKIASASADHTVRLWNARTGQALGDALEHADSVNVVTFSSTWLASGSSDRTIRLWNASTGQPSHLGPLNCDGAVYSLSFSPSGQLLAAGDSTGCIRLWQAANGDPYSGSLRAGRMAVHSICFSPNGALLVSGGADSRRRVWKVRTGEVIRAQAIQGENNCLFSVAFLGNKRIVTGSKDGVIRRWRISGQRDVGVQVKLKWHTGAVTSVAVSDAQSVVSCSVDKTIRVWDMSLAATSQGKGQMAVLASSSLKGCWLVSQSDDALVWVPAEYHMHLQLPPCTMLIDRSRVALTVGSTGWYHGRNWTSCWRHDMANTM